MTKTFICFALILCLALPVLGQQPKSQEEVDALIAIQEAQDPDARIAACDKLLKEFADTEFKEFAHQVMMASYQQKNDFENMLIHGEKTLELNPENLAALLSLSFAIPLRTREFDLDKEEKLGKAEGYAQRALKLIPTMESPNPNVPPEEWLLAKKGFMSQAHESLGTIALLRKDHPRAEEAFREALQVAPEQTPDLFYKLGRALKEQGKYDEAIDALDKSIERGGQKMANGRDAAVLLKAETVQQKEGGATPGEAQQQGVEPQVQIQTPQP